MSGQSAGGASDSGVAPTPLATRDSPTKRRPTGTVYLVGAGPGDPGLLTLRAAELLRRADIVVYDALANARLLAFAPRAAERIDVGKRCGGRRTSQRQIHRMLIEAAGRAAVVVRLKGGDPFIFGRGGEEALALAQAGVPFEVVPGVTAGIGAAAYAGIPLTHRDYSSSVTFVTGHEDASRPGSRVDWDALARIDGTLVVYMGIRRLRAIAGRLIRAGRPADTPAAAVEWGTYPFQRTVLAPLGEIAAAVAREGLGTPAIVVVGAVAALREQLEWFERPHLGRPPPADGPSRRRPSTSEDAPRASATTLDEFFSQPSQEAQRAGAAAGRTRVAPQR